VACGGSPTTPPSPEPVAAAPHGARGEADPAAGPRTTLHPSGLDVVLLGTGTPVPDPERHGPATAFVFEGRSFVVDTGPGVGRRLAEAASMHRQPALHPGSVGLVLLTHLHSDHTSGLPELILGGWVVGRGRALQVIGPPGTKAMVDGILEGWATDIEIRQGVEDLPPSGIDVRVREIDTDGVIVDDRGLKITAFHVPHGTFDHAFGFRVDAGGRSVVVSGDTDRAEVIARMCDGCDLLIHEAFSAEGFAASRSPSFHRYHGTFHTSAVEVGELATEGKAEQVVLTHQLFFGDSEEGLVEEVRSAYDGPVTSGHDLDRY